MVCVMKLTAFIAKFSMVRVTANEGRVSTERERERETGGNMDRIIFFTSLQPLNSTK